jgi:hypothetical protein
MNSAIGSANDAVCMLGCNVLKRMRALTYMDDRGLAFSAHFVTLQVNSHAMTLQP